MIAGALQHRRTRIPGAVDAKIPIFLPVTNIANLQQWLRSDAIVGLIDGDPVQTWLDSSGNGYDATQGTLAYRPIYKVNRVNGKPGLYLADESFWITGGYDPSLPYTLFLVYKRTGVTGNRVINGSNNWLLGPYGGNNSSYTGDFITGDFVALNVTVYTTLTEAAGIAELFQNGVSKGTVSDDGLPGTIYMGGGGLYASEGAACDLVEMIIYSRKLTTTEIGIIHAYLKAKYAL